MIKNIIFDVGMVLVDFRYRAYMKDLGLKDETIEALSKQMVLSPEWSRLDQGEEIPDMIQYFKKKLPEYTEEIDLFWSRTEELVEPFVDTRTWLSDLKKAGYHLYVLSNYPQDMFALHTKTRFNFMDLLDGKIVSGEVKVIKPNAAIFELLLGTFNLKPEESVFLDDRLENVEAARKLKIQGIQVTDQKQAIKDLDAMLHTM